MKNGVHKEWRLTSLEIDNWRNFSHVSVPLASRVLLVGPNASGKSNFLDVFRFVRDIASSSSERGGGFQNALGLRGGVSKVRSLAARTNSDIVLRFQVGTDEAPKLWDYRLHFGQTPQDESPVILKEVIEREGRVVRRRPDDEDKRDPRRLTATALEQLGENEEFRELADFFASVEYLHIVPQLIRDPQRSLGIRHDPYGGDFLDTVAGISSRDRSARLTRIEKALQKILPQIKDLEFHQDKKTGKPHLRAKYQHWRPQGAWQNEDQFSDGTLRFIGLLWSLLESGGPILLEEPELSLHPAVIQRLPGLLARMHAASGRQILITTHSADLLKDPGIGLDEVLLLRPDENGTQITTAKSIRDVDRLLEDKVSLSDLVMPLTAPDQVNQLSFAFGGGQKS